MIYGILITLCVAGIPAFPQSAPPQDHGPRPAHPGHSAEHYRKTLEHPERDGWQKPQEVVAALALQKGEVVVDLGARTGYFSRRFAALGAKVWAVDIEPQLVEHLRASSPPGVEARLARPDDPGLPPKSVDTIFICNVLHHIDHRGAYLPKLKQALKPGGRIVVLEFLPGDLPVGPPAQYKISEAEMDAEMAAVGLRRTRSLGKLPYQYFFEYR